MKLIEDLRDRVKAFNDRLTNGTYIKDIIEENDDYIIEMNEQDQLYDSGINTSGVKIMSYKPYKPLTIRIKKEKGQPVDRVTLRDTGDFQSSIYLEVGNEQFEIKANDWKTDDLIKKYGREILGLTDENLLDLIWNFIYPDILEKAKSEIYG